MPRAVLPQNIPALPDTEAEALACIRDLLTRGWVEEARDFIWDVAARWPESPQVQHYVKVLEPPRVISRGGQPARSMDEEYAWVGAGAPARVSGLLDDRLRQPSHRRRPRPEESPRGDARRHRRRRSADPSRSGKTPVTQEFTGRAAYLTDHFEGPHRLVVAVRCRIGDLLAEIPALLDTGSEWCVVSPHLLQAAGYADLFAPGSEELHTRFGILTGSLERLPITFKATEGDHLTIEATCFVSDEWLGPIVIGWKGCLERMRFALDPTDDTFYFASS
jgi:hypothetical protein